SIDYAVMEQLTEKENAKFKGAIIPLDAGWSDVGSWQSIWDIGVKDASGNVRSGDVFLHDSQNSLIMAESRIVAGIGLENIVIVETPDAVMVANKNNSQNVKDIVTQLKAEKRDEALFHRKVYRPWGSYQGVDAGERYQVKHIEVKPGASLSLQMHHHRAEHWIVVSGTARVTRGEEEFILSENESTYIPLGVTHRLENPGTIPLKIIEVQSGTYLGEDDIVRFEDKYGRREP
ncbi:MAG: cupin domain-containing protein, partial [Gammaproteobacteria bacterium]|nr:cupin domain-containing protein [Gammaproteobacteria bacterium]